MQMMTLFQRSGSHVSDVAIDFGTANMMVGEAGSGIIFDEPSVCCFVNEGVRSSLYTAGAEARAIMERETGRYRIARPLRQGVMSDIDAGRELLRYAIGRSGSPRMFSRAKAIVGVPVDATQAERQALLTAVRDAGVSKASLFDEPLMAAIGAGLPVDEPRGRMLVDCGAGTTEVAVISLGRICLSKSVRIGGDTLDEALVSHFQTHHRFNIGLRTAEEVKLKIVALGKSTEHAHRMIEVRGIDGRQSSPGRLSVPIQEVFVPVSRHVGIVVNAVKAALSETSPELSRDILDDGITLTGGSSTITLLSESIAEATGLSVHIAERPRDCVALGLKSILQAGR